MSCNYVSVIPIYSETLDEEKIKALENNIKVMSGNTDIAFVYPEGLNLDFYKKYSTKFFPFDASFFKSTKTYNYLVLSRGFYETFSSYKMIFIVQLDVWLFDNQFKEWGESGYDYVGAPWLVPIYVKEVGNILNGVGNGGFSMRNPRKFIEVIEDNEDNIKLWLEQGYYEDIIISFKLKDKFNIPPSDKAVYFSWETNPGEAYMLTNGKLPFGWHGYLSYNKGLFKNLANWEN
jgi:hypothetical protein